MKGKMSKTHCWLVLLALAVAFVPAALKADTFTFYLDTYMGGNDLNQPPVNVPPWVKVEFKDTGLDQVTLTLDNLSLWYTGTTPGQGREHVGYFYFNVIEPFAGISFDPSPNSYGVSIDKYDTPAAQGGPSGPIQFLTNVKFDVRIMFKDDYFPKNDPYSIVISASGLTASAFNLPDKSGKWYAAAWVEDIDIYEPPPKNTWVYGKAAAIGAPATVIPEPGTMFLLGSGLVGLAGLVRRNFSRKRANS